MRVAQISFHRDAQDRAPAQLLEAWPTLSQLAESAASADVDVCVIQASGHREMLARDGIPYRFMPAEPAALSDALARLRPDALHVQGLGFAPEVLMLAALAPGVPIVLQDRADRPPRRVWRWPLWRRALGAARGVMFCAPEQARPFRRRGLLPAATRVYALPGSSSRFTPGEPGDRAAARAATGIDGEPALLWVGHLDANKDPLTVLDGVARAAARLPGLRLWCCHGSAPLRAAVEARCAADPRLRDRVRLLGARPHAEIETLMRAADLFVLGSRREATGYAVLEALACGLPPVVTDIAPFRALLGADGGNLWRPGDADALAAALARAGGAPSAQARRAARDRFEQELSPAALGRRLRAIYADMLRT